MSDADELLKEWFPDNDVSFDALRGQIQTVTLPADQTVFYRGDPCSNYLFVINGSVRIQALSAGGR